MYILYTMGASIKLILIITVNISCEIKMYEIFLSMWYFKLNDDLLY